jgi:hypothetical protein
MGGQKKGPACAGQGGGGYAPWRGCRSTLGHLLRNTLAPSLLSPMQAWMPIIFMLAVIAVMAVITYLVS